MDAEFILTGVDDLTAALKSIDDQLTGMILDGLEEVGKEMADKMNAIDTLNVAHGSFTVQRRKTTVAVGPAKAPRGQQNRGRITRLHEYGTVHHGATPTMRIVADSGETTAAVKAKMTRRLKQAIAIAGKGAKRK